jgi:hypothetical protein
MHGPRVEDGTRLMLAVGATRTLDWEDEPIRFVPTAWVGLQRGWMTDGPAVHTGVQSPILPSLPELIDLTTIDLYLQPVRTVDAGFGLTASLAQVAPYAQVGLFETAGGAHVYTTQAVAWNSDRVSDTDVYWFPSIALEGTRPDRSRSVTVQISGGIGLGEARPAWTGALAFIVGFQLDSGR